MSTIVGLTIIVVPRNPRSDKGEESSFLKVAQQMPAGPARQVE